MNTHTLPSRQIPLDDSFDVIVIGGGPSGCTAAAAAARDGARTLLIERTCSLGGMGTSALVPAWCPFSDKEKMVYRGLAERVFLASKAGAHHIPEKQLDWVPIDPEKLKRVYDDLVTSFGVTVLFDTLLASVETDGAGNVTAIVVANKAGLNAYRAKVYIDTTGDADLTAWAGAEFHKGDDDSGDLQPATHCFVLANVDEYAYRFAPAGINLNRIVAEGKHPLIPDTHCCNNTIGPGCVGFNAGHVWQVDNTDPFSVSKAVIHGRKIAAAMRDAFAEYYPAVFGNAFLVMTGSLLGVRETRRIVGDYELTLDDYLARKSFDDEICRNSYFIDVHHAKAEAHKRTDSADFEKRSFRYNPGESHGIPYRCLTPKGLRNVLVAGRSISCDRPVQGSVRVMPVCLAMGEAAGAAAAQALKAPSIDVHAIDVTALRKRLREAGAYLP